MNEKEAKKKKNGRTIINAYTTQITGVAIIMIERGMKNKLSFVCRSLIFILA